MKSGSDLGLRPGLWPNSTSADGASLGDTGGADPVATPPGVGALPDPAALESLGAPPNAASVGRSTGQQPLTLAGRTGAFETTAMRALLSARGTFAQGPQRDSVLQEARIRRIGAAVDDAIRAVDGQPAARFLQAVRPFFALHNESYSALMMPAVFDAAAALLGAPADAKSRLAGLLARADLSSHAQVALGAAAAALLAPGHEVAELIDRELAGLLARHAGMFPTPASTAAALGRIGLAIDEQGDARAQRRTLLAALTAELERPMSYEHREGSLRAIGLVLAKIGEGASEVPAAHFAARLARWVAPKSSGFSGALLTPGLEALEILGRPPPVARALILDRLGRAEGMHEQLVLGMAAAAITPGRTRTALEGALDRAEARLSSGGLYRELTADVVASAYRVLEQAS